MNQYIYVYKVVYLYSHAYFYHSTVRNYISRSRFLYVASDGERKRTKEYDPVIPTVYENTFCLRRERCDLVLGALSQALCYVVPELKVHTRPLARDPSVPGVTLAAIGQSRASSGLAIGSPSYVPQATTITNLQFHLLIYFSRIFPVLYAPFVGVQ